MKIQIENLGKVSVTVEKDPWDINKEYDRLTIVQVKHLYACYISRKPVPVGVYVLDRNYWIPFSSLNPDILIDYQHFLDSIDAIDSFVKTNIEQLKTDINNLPDYGEDFEIKDDNKVYLNKITEEELDNILI